MLGGSAFQRVEAATEKAQSPWFCGEVSFWVQQISEVRRALGVKGFVGELKDFEVKTLWNREPLQILKNGCDLVLEMGVSAELRCRILDELVCLTEIKGTQLSMSWF